MNNQTSPTRTRTSLKSAAMVFIFVIVAAWSSGQLRGAVLETQVSIWAPKLAKLARMTGFTQAPAALVQQGDTRKVPGAQSKPGAPTEPVPVDDSVSLLVKTVPGLSDQAADALVTRHGAGRKGRIGKLRLNVVKVPAAAAEAMMRRLKADPDIERVEVDQRRKIARQIVGPSDPGHAAQWSLETVRWNAAWQSVSMVGSARIAVLDTGVSAAGGEINVADGWSAFGTDPKADLNGHGTWVASIAAAVADNNRGIAGISFGNTAVVPVQVLDPNGNGQDSDVINGLLWAVDNNVDVVLMAFSNAGYSQSLQDAIDLAWSNGIVIVAAAGNDASSTPTFPAGDSKVVGVAATDQADALWLQSNYGKTAFLAAPGVDISGMRPDGTILSTNGTSASAAMVAGAAALLKIADPLATNGAIVGRLARNADVAGTQEQTGNGRLNIERALADFSTAEIVPVGAPPEGDGGPFVGPYRIAAAIVMSATLNGAGTVTVAPSASISAAVTVRSQNDNANNVVGSIGWRISTAPGAMTCVDVLDVSNQNNQVRTFNITAPAIGGTYNAYFIAYSDNACTSNASSTLTLANGVIVQGTRPTTTTLASSANPSIYAQSVTFTASVSAAAGNPGVNGTVTFKDGASVLCNAVSLNSSSVATCATSTLTAAASPHSITAAYSGATAAGTTWDSSTSAALPQTVNKANQTITFTSTAPSSGVVGNTYTPTATGGASGNPVTFGASGACSYNAGTVTMNSAGNCTVTANQAGDSNYNAAIQGTQVLTVGKASQTITITQNAPATGAYNTSFDIKATGGASANAITFLPVPGSACSVGTVTSLSGAFTASVTMTSGTGTCQLTLNQAGDTNYSAATQVTSATTTAAKVSQTITFVAPASPATYSSTFAVTPSASSTLAVSVAVSGVCSIASSSVTMTSGTGECTLTASQAGNSNYSAATDVVRTVSAAKTSQTITFAAPASPATYNSTFAVTPSASSTLAVSVAASGVCSVASSSVTMTSGTGSCVLTASQAGDANYSAATAVERTVAATKATQTITFAPLSNKTFGDASFSVSGTSGSALQVNFAADLEDKCSVAGSLVTLTGAGNCSVSASQAGDANYEAAPVVTRSFAIAKAGSTTVVSCPSGGQTYTGSALEVCTAQVTGAGGLEAA
ncbi:MAG: S8 family serine peptidase, partial [Vicinamibacterales bacterium]